MPDPTKPLKIKDLKEFERRQQAYNDSLSSWVNSNETFNYIINKGNEYVYDPSGRDIYDYEDLLSIAEKSHPLMGSLPIYLSGGEGNATEPMGYIPLHKGSTGAGSALFEVYKKPTQPVEYDPVKKPSYEQIPVKTPTVIPTQQATEEALKTFPVENAYVPPKDVRRFTAGNYLESQGLPSGYVNYGEGKGRKEMYADGGVRNTQSSQEKIIDSFYTPQQSALMGSHASYPYRTLQDPSLGDINISIPQYHDPNTIRELKLEKRLRPSNIPTDSSFRDINNNDIGTLFNQRFGIQ